MTKICVTSSGPTLESTVDPRFGRCAYFIIADSETYAFEAVSNEAAMASGGAGIRAAQTVTSMNVDAVLTGSVGPALQDAGIKILAGVSGTVKAAIENYNNDGYQELATPGPSNVGKGQGGPGRGLGMGRGGGRGMGRGGGGRGRHRGGRNS